MLEDIAILTGGVVISEEVGRTLESVEMNDLGHAKKVIVGKENTIIVEGSGEKKDIDNRIEMIKKQIDKTTSDYDKEKLQERLAKIAGGVAVIKVGAATETEHTITIEAEEVVEPEPEEKGYDYTPIIIGLLIAIVLIGGAAYYFKGKGKSKKPTEKKKGKK